MDPGRVIAGRFEIAARAAEGGMGTVFRARDIETGEHVALKVLKDASAETAARFDREGRVLAEIRHDGVVGYRGQGTTPDGQLWLAMDWIEGETLAQRLTRGPLSVEQTVTLGIAVANALGEAHERGLVHRDIKPSNLLLAAGDVARVKVVDFGIVQLGAKPGNTQEGQVLGTPGYMAPEQARAAKGVDARADVFSLGCVLFECLTGTPAFSGEHMLAILAKIILDEAPRVTELRPEVPSGLADLIATMLAKEPERRPANGLAAARALETFPAAGARASKPRLPSLTEGEQRIVTVVLAGDANHRGVEATMPSMVADVELEQIRSTTLPPDCQLERLADGTYLIAIWGRSNARDQAMQAAHAAISVAAILPHAIVVATGRGVLAGRWPVGEVIDRAARLLRRSSTAGRIRIDELTAGLLDSRYKVSVENGAFYLAREVASQDAARRLCGVPTSCVGRDRELRMLEDEFAEVREDEIARAVLIVAPGGVGKSRLRQELLARLSHVAPFELLIGRGDPMRAGSPFGLLAHALRWTFGLVDGEPVIAQRARVAAHVGRFFAGAAAARVATFLGELAGVQGDARDLALQAARRDPLLMNDQRRDAWLEYLRAASRERPIVIVLEDLHLGDAGTVALVDLALRDLADCPIFVLALARPEIRDHFPKLWAGRMLTELALPELSKKAAEKLVREVLGADAQPDTIARVVERAAGNAFYLEELIRAVAAGDARLPETVLATVQTRLEALAPSLRRTLRAGSVFGEVFSEEGVAALVDEPCDAALAELVERELLYRRTSSRSGAEFAFRHALVREAAYAMLTEQDRTLGHQLAGAWLEAAGEPDALLLAEHFERGGVSDRAIGAYLRAAEQALAGNDFAAALSRAQKGLSLGASGELSGLLQLVQADAHRWRGELVDAGTRADRALAHLPVGSAAWFRATETVIMASGRRADYADVIARARLVAVTPALDEEARSARVSCLCEAGRGLLQTGRYDMAAEVAATVDQLAADLSGLESGAIVQIHRLRAARARHKGDLAGDLHGYQAVLAAFERCGDLRNACNARVSVGFAFIELGDFTRADAELRRALADAERMVLDTVVTRARQNLALVVSYGGDHATAIAMLEQVIGESAAQGNQRFEAWTRIYLSMVSLAAGDHATAASEAELAAAAFAETPPARAGALAALARARARQGRADALTAAQMAMTILETFSGIEEFESLVWLAMVEATRAASSPDAGRWAARARVRLLERAASITDPDLRASFLAVPENAELAKR